MNLFNLIKTYPDEESSELKFIVNAKRLIVDVFHDIKPKHLDEI